MPPAKEKGNELHQNASPLAESCPEGRGSEKFNLGRRRHGRRQRLRRRALLASGFLLFSSTVALFCLERKRHRQRVWRQRGTLAKIVYFERHEAGNDTRKRPRSASLDVAAGEMNEFLREHHSFGSTGCRT
ncbi:hypothetical protein GQ600_8036 [Phytophthora cactorum]|nr:hypothetical protein GQ600_8036 [Phytophthora cactorum]